MTAPEALAWLFFGLWLVTTGLYVIKAAGYDDALTDLRGAQKALDEMAVRVWDAEASVLKAEQMVEDALTVLTACTTPVAVDISDDVADLHATTHFEDLGWDA